jgi:transcriptional regulator with XRE-family HTH domain
MTSPHERLDQAMDARRLDLDLSWKEVAAAANVSEATLRAIRAGKSQPSDLTKRRTEEALLWAAGSIDTILDGGTPTPLRPQEPPPGAEDPHAMIREGQELIARAMKMIEEREQRRPAG